MSFLLHQALPQKYVLHKLQQLHVARHNFNMTTETGHTTSGNNCCNTENENKEPSTYQNVNFGDDSSFRINSKSKIDLENENYFSQRNSVLTLS